MHAIASKSTSRSVLPAPVPVSHGHRSARVFRIASSNHHASYKTEAFSVGQTVIFHGDAAEFFFEIMFGTVRCCKLTEDGRRQIYSFAGPGEMVGLGGEAAYSYSVECVNEVTVRRYRLASLDAAMAADEGLRERVVQSLRAEVTAARTHMMLLGRMSAAERIAAFLRALAARATGPDGCIHLTLSRSDIADYLGLTLETVSRKMNALRRLGVIEMSTPCRVRITDLARLDESCRGCMIGGEFVATAAARSRDSRSGQARCGNGVAPHPCERRCRKCGEECKSHDGEHEHCRICAESCKRCADACQAALADVH